MTPESMIEMFFRDINNGRVYKHEDQWMMKRSSRKNYPDIVIGCRSGGIHPQVRAALEEAWKRTKGDANAK